MWTARGSGGNGEIHAETVTQSGRETNMVYAVIAIVAHVLGALTALHALLTARTPQASLAWAAGLIGFPYLALPLYWIFGRSRFHGYRLAHLSKDEEIQKGLARFKERMDGHRADLTGDAARFEVVEKLARAPFTKGNHAHLLVDGEETFPAIWEGIDSAKDYVLVEFYIIHDDEIGRQLKDHLVAKAKEGVRVYLAFDGVGSHDLPESYQNELREAGAEVRYFRTRKGPGNRFQVNFRNHRKIVVVDGKLGFVGGLNVGDEYVGKGPLSPWRDTHLKVEGPLIQTIQLAWVQDWNWADGDVPELTWEPTPAANGDMIAVSVPTGPADEIPSGSAYATHLIHSARKRVWIASPYFIPDEPALYALGLAAMRGVDVRIIIPEESDSALVQLARNMFFKQLADLGVKFFLHRPGFMHQKVILVDDDFASVGTFNFDIRSFRLNFEIVAAVIDQVFAGEVEKMLTNDLGQSRPMEKNEYEDWSIWFRLKVRIAFLFSQTM
jgi:cardiolipin synthase